jgi:membrane protease YdiL (CAAX protease family)
MDDTTQDTPQKKLPFNNLLLNSGFVHGINHWSIYVLTISFTVFCYLFSPVITFLHLFFMAKQNGITNEEIISDLNIILDSKATGIDLNYILLGLFGIFVFASGALWIGIKKFHHKSLLSVITAYDAFRYKRFWFAFALWSGLIILTVFIDYFSNQSNFQLVLNWKGFLISLVLILVFMPVQTGFEEIFFRGYLLQGFALLSRNGIFPLIITSLLFGAAHMSNPEVDKYGWPIMLSYYAGFGFFMGALTLLDEGLELAFGIHLANNLISSILITSPDSVIKTYSIFETTSQDPYTEVLVWLCMTVLAFAIFWYKYRWKNFKLIIR